jgi:hypothetical protein
MKDNNKVYNMSQKTYNIGDNKNRSYVGKRAAAVGVDTSVKTLTLRDIVKAFKDLDEEFKRDGEYIILHTGVYINNDKEIDLKVKPVDDKFINIETTEDFGIYMENNYSLKEASKKVLSMIDKKKHSGLISFNEKDWSIVSLCLLSDYVYDKWAIAEIVEDICCDIFSD